MNVEARGTTHTITEVRCHTPRHKSKMQLKVSLRSNSPPFSPHSTLYNSFIRIHPKTLRKLYSTLNANGVASSSIDSKVEGHNPSWSIEDNYGIDFTDSSNNIEFLPLEIKFILSHPSPNIVTCYGSYNGGSCDQGKLYFH